MKKAILFLIFMVSLNSSYAQSDNERINSIIIMIPDGMSNSDVTLGRWYNGGKCFSFDKYSCGLVRTYSANSILTDSAAAATAFATGYKTNTGYLGVAPHNSDLSNEIRATKSNYEPFHPLANVLEGAKLLGKSTGIIATSHIQDATPGGYSAHTANRDYIESIAEQQVYSNIDIMLGGGKQYLLPHNRKDKEDMIAILKEKGYEIALTSDELKYATSQKIWGAFADKDLSYDMDRSHEQPSLEEMTQKAISVLSQNPNGFFLVIEGSKVDWAAHANDPIGVISEINSFDRAVNIALMFSQNNKNTAILIFTDHGNGGLSIGKDDNECTLDKFVGPFKKAIRTGEGTEKEIGKNKTPENIKYIVAEYYGINDLSDDEVKTIMNSKQELNYILGPMYSKRANITWTTNNHTGEDITLYVYSPIKNQLNGLIDNTHLADFVAKTFGMNMNALTDSLFVNLIPALESRNIQYSIDGIEIDNAQLVIKFGENSVKVPANKNYCIINGREIISKSNNIFISKDHIYVSSELIDEITTSLRSNTFSKNKLTTQ